MSLRTDITYGLSKLTEAYLKSKPHKWGSEIIFYNHDNIRVDYMSIQVCGGAYADIYNIDHGIVNIFEIKSCMDDYKSGNGLNNIGDNNYLVAPYSLIMDLVDRNLINTSFQSVYPVPEEFTLSKWFMLEEDIKNYKGQIDGWKLYIPKAEINRDKNHRKFAMIEYVWALLYQT